MKNAIQIKQKSIDKLKIGDSITIPDKLDVEKQQKLTERCTRPWRSKKTQEEIEREIIEDAIEVHKVISKPLKAVIQKYRKGKLQDDPLTQQETLVVKAVISNLKEVKTDQGGVMAFADLTDDTATVELVCFPLAYDKFRQKLVISKPLALKVKEHFHDGKLKLILEAAL